MIGLYVSAKWIIINVFINQGRVAKANINKRDIARVLHKHLFSITLTAAANFRA